MKGRVVFGARGFFGARGVSARGVSARGVGARGVGARGVGARGVGARCVGLRNGACEKRCKPTPPFEIGSIIDAFWPDEETWLLATVKELVDEKLRIEWHEDGSESLVPFGYVRVHTAVEHEAAPPTPQKAMPSAWCRMSSRSKEGQYYYYNSVTLETQLEPPHPWQLCKSRRNPDVMYYWHRLSGRTSLEKPEILEGE